MASVRFLTRDFYEHLPTHIIQDSMSRFPKHEPKLFTWERLSPTVEASCLSALHHIPGARHRETNVAPRLGELFFQNLNMGRHIPSHLPFISLWKFLGHFKLAWLCLLCLYIALVWVKGRLTMKPAPSAFPTINDMVILYQSVAWCVFSLLVSSVNCYFLLQYPV